MAKWRIKEMSDLTKISIRMLRHYDEIGLLKPSLRLSNGYRLYSENDLLKLQQIVALKFFEFSLSQIKKIMKEKLDPLEQLQAQDQILQEQIAQLQDVQKTLSMIITQSKKNRSIEWSNIITLIKGYSMTQYLKKHAEKMFNEKHLTQWAEIEQKYSEQEMTAYQQRWQKLINKVKQHLDDDPAGPIGKRLSSAWQTLLNEVYKNYPELKEGFSKAYRENLIPDVPFDKKLSDWIERAFKAHGLE